MIALIIVMLNSTISFASSDLLLPPVIQGNKELTPPPEAANYQLAGTVSLKINILRDGTTGKISIAKSSGYEVLDKAALDAARS